MRERYTGGLVHQGISAELIARKWDLPRGELDALGLESHRRAARARAEGRFGGQIVPVPVQMATGELIFDQDEGIRPDTSLEKLAGLEAGLQGGRRDHRRQRLADQRWRGGDADHGARGRPSGWGCGRARASSRFSLAGADPILMLTAPIPATQNVLAARG